MSDGKAYYACYYYRKATTTLEDGRETGTMTYTLSPLIVAHHALETRLRLLRNERDAGLPTYRESDEDALLDEMEALWYRMTSEEQKTLDAQRGDSASVKRPEMDLNTRYIKGLEDMLTAASWVNDVANVPWLLGFRFKVVKELERAKHEGMPVRYLRSLPGQQSSTPSQPIKDQPKESTMENVTTSTLDTAPLAHCCGCSVVCFHIGPPVLCEKHDPHSRFSLPQPWSPAPVQPQPALRPPCAWGQASGHEFVETSDGTHLFCRSCGRLIPKGYADPNAPRRTLGMNLPGTTGWTGSESASDREALLADLAAQRSPNTAPPGTTGWT